MGCSTVFLNPTCLKPTSSFPCMSYHLPSFPSPQILCCVTHISIYHQVQNQTPDFSAIFLKIQNCIQSFSSVIHSNIILKANQHQTMSQVLSLLRNTLSLCPFLPISTPMHKIFITYVFIYCQSSISYLHDSDVAPVYIFT